MKIESKTLMALGIASVAGVILLGCGGKNGGSSNSADLSATAFARIAKLGQGMLIYAGDYDESLPLSNWADATLPYVKDRINYNSPAVPSGQFGFAFNSELVGRTLVAMARPDTVPMIFDSTDLAWNAVESFSSMPAPPRYGTMNAVAFADGHTNVPITDFLAESLSRVKKQAVGILIYVNDYDDNLPMGRSWMDGLAPYVRTETVFHDPALSPTQYGYAFRPEISGKAITSFANPATAVGTFDSTNTSRNAVAELSTLPTPGRYGGKNVESFLDGHAISF